MVLQSRQTRVRAVKFDWNDLRFFAAVLEHGSTARAARAIGVDQTTVARRISALEGALGIELFERDQTGYRPTPAAEVLQPSLLAVTAQMEQFAREAATATRRVKRRIRITGEDSIMRTLVVPALTRFAAEYPDVQLEIDVSAQVRDLQAGEADIAVRASPAPEEPSLVRRRLSDAPWAVYCSAAYAAARGAPKSMEDFAGHSIVLLEGTLEEARAAGVKGEIQQMASSVAAVEAVIRTGACVGALPCIVADATGDLMFCFPAPTSSAIWLVYPERLRRAPEVRALSRIIAEAFQQRGERASV
jgi:DNA-binding transcriptional LysR family regulator